MKCHTNFNLQKIKCHSKIYFVYIKTKKCYVTKDEMSQNMKSYKRWNVSKYEISQKGNMSQKMNVTKSFIAHNFKFYKRWNMAKHEML